MFGGRSITSISSFIIRIIFIEGGSVLVVLIIVFEISTEFTVKGKLFFVSVESKKVLLVRDRITDIVNNFYF